MADLKLVKELREKTGAGFLDVKKALEASNNDINKAVKWLKSQGVVKASKKENAEAREGIIEIVQNKEKMVIFELNCQTDFVAINKVFLKLKDDISRILLNNTFKNLAEAIEWTDSNQKDSIKDLSIQATAVLGEKISLKRFKVVEKQNFTIGQYVHTNKKIGAIFISEGGDEETARKIAMHIASMNPTYLNQNDISKTELLELKKEIESSKAVLQKPENIRPRIVEGMLRKVLSENTLVDQEFVMEKISVSGFLKRNKMKEIQMIRFQVGEI